MSSVAERMEGVRRFARNVDFGRAAADYGRYRVGFPDAFFHRLGKQLPLRPGGRALDIGTGTGTVARGLARLGLEVIATDPALPLLEEARALTTAEGLAVDYRRGTAEAPDFPDGMFDVVTAGQCWHWFERAAAARATFRLLKPGGALVIAHLDWLPLPGNVVAATEAMICQVNPGWAVMAGDGTGLHPQWLMDLHQAGFGGIETHSFDVLQPYSHEAWRGRIRASAGIKAMLDEAAVAVFDAGLAAMLARDYPADPLGIPHRVWWVSGVKPQSD